MQRKVINTRISKDLYEKIAAKAKKNRVTVSNLIRNLVEDALEISEDVFYIVDDKIKKQFDKHPEATIVGYQSIVLAKDTACSLCDRQLKKGTHTYIAFWENASTKLIVCDDCKKEQEEKAEDTTHADGKNEK